MNEIDNIYKLLSEGERVTLECKKATKGVPSSLWDTYSAFANTYGGSILLGVVEHMDEQDNVKRFEIVGVEDADKIRKDLWNTVNSHEKVNINLLYDDDIQTIDIDGKKIIAINVPRADYTVRPVYINNNLSRGTFKRNHEGDYHCTEQELKMMLRDANEAGNDGLLLEYYTMDDIDIPTLERFRQMFQNLHPEHQWNSSEHKEFLTNFGGYTKDRKTGKEGLTMAGLLMFGSGFPLILNAWNEKHWIKPELLEQYELMQVKLTLHIQNRLKNEPVNEPVNERQQAILSAMKQNPSITREDLANKINVSLATLKRDLVSLKKAGYITRSGSDKNGHWILIK